VFVGGGGSQRGGREKKSGGAIGEDVIKLGRPVKARYSRAWEKTGLRLGVTAGRPIAICREPENEELKIEGNECNYGLSCTVLGGELSRSSELLLREKWKSSG